MVIVKHASTQMLIGEHTQKLTEKNRISVPKAFRDKLGNQVVITKGYEGCLVMTSAEDFENFVTPLKEGPFLSKAVRDSTRFLVGGAHNVDLDDQGRFVMPKSLLEYSGIGKIVVFAGLHRWVEIWDEAKWNERMSQVEANAAEIAETLNSEKSGD